MTPEQLDCSGGLTPRRGTTQAGHIQLSYLEWGTAGRHMLLLHGITSSAASWWQVAPALARQGYHVFAFDMPGHGLSDTTDDHRIDAIAATVAAAARARSLDNPVVIGHSWGGATTLAE
ncbi:MAG: alpha/beta hydrolase, partial [Chloroflexaceae bacterium]|nr:alpha/beta hydrolase [Chloroflexaceae bacterium]